MTDLRPNEPVLASRARRRSTLAPVLMAAAGLLAMALAWWLESGASHLPREQDVARTLSERWGLQVEVHGLELQPGAANALQVRIAKLVVRDPQLGFAAQLEPAP